MSKPPRYPVEVLHRLEAPAPVRVSGRLTARDDGAVRLRGDTGAVWIECASEAPMGSWVTATGEWNGERIRAGRVRILNAPRVPFPQPGGDWARLQDGDGRRATLLRSRALIMREIRRFFDERSFLEVDTPPMVPSPGLDLHLDAFPIAGAEPARYLATSPEYQMKRLLAGGLPRIYQLGCAFRRGEQGKHHEPSFRMLEWYRAFHGSADLMVDTEELVAAVARTLHKGSMVLDVDGTSVNLAPPWERLTLEQAFSRYAGVSAEALAHDEDVFFRVLVEQVEPQLGRLRPVFLLGYPASMASLARLDPRNPKVADRFEAYIAGVELCNGFGELIDPAEQRERLTRDQAARRARDLPVYPIDERFLGALEEGMPPAGGNALGVDRLVMLLLGADSIADVVAIPDALL